MTDYQKRIIRTLADCDMNIAKTAILLNHSRNSMEYQINKIAKNTGLNPKNFYDLAKLVKMA